MTGEKPPHDPRRSAEAHPDRARTAREKDAALEKGLEDSFPASDPPASSTPTRTVGWEEPEGADKAKSSTRH